MMKTNEGLFIMIKGMGGGWVIKQGGGRIENFSNPGGLGLREKKKKGKKQVLIMIR